MKKKEYQYKVSFYKKIKGALWVYCGNSHWSENNEEQMTYTIKKTKKFIKAHLWYIFSMVGIDDYCNTKIIFDGKAVI